MRAITKAKDESEPKGRRRHLALPRINIGTEKKKKKDVYGKYFAIRPRPFSSFIFNPILVPA